MEEQTENSEKGTENRTDKINSKGTTKVKLVNANKKMMKYIKKKADTLESEHKKTAEEVKSGGRKEKRGQ